MEAKFTPGPWSIRPNYGLLKSEIGPLGRAVASVWTKQAGTREEQKDPVSWPEGEANANLIAAAPALYREMERYLKVLERLEAMPERWEICVSGTGIVTANGYRAALKKARGEEA